jgi:protein required for attachment to host cells
MRAKRDWYLVIDSGRARILQGLPAPGAPAGPEIRLSAPVHKLRDLMADRPGRSFASAGGGRRSAMEYASDPVTEERRALVRRALDRLERHRRRGDFDRFVLVAGPRLLGLVREALSPPLKAALAREIEKDLAGLSPAALVEALRREVASA